MYNPQSLVSGSIWQFGPVGMVWKKVNIKHQKVTRINGPKTIIIINDGDDAYDFINQETQPFTIYLEGRNLFVFQ